MRPSRLPVAVLATSFLFAVPLFARAQSAPGLNIAEAGLGLGSESGAAPAVGLIAGDVRVTGIHGVQLDLSVTDFEAGLLGEVNLHLYLQPSEVAKYGFVVTLADADGREATIGTAGIEGLFQIGASTFASGQAMLGYARPGDIDFISLSGGLLAALNDTTSVQATLDVAEFDEAALRTTVYTARLGVSYQPEGSPWEVRAGVAFDGATEMAWSDSTWAEIGLTWRFGGPGGATRPVAARLFRTGQPFDPLLRRGIF